MDLDEIVTLAGDDPAQNEPELSLEGAGEGGEKKSASGEGGGDVQTKPEPTPAPAPPAIDPQSVASRQDLESLNNTVRDLAYRLGQAQSNQQPQRQQPPDWSPQDPDDPDDLLVDSKKLWNTIKGNLQGLKEHQRQENGQALNYVAGLVQDLRQQLQALAPSVSSNAREKARAAVKEQGFEDFDEVWGDIEAITQGNAQLLANPDFIQDAYYVARRRKGLPMRAEAKSEPPPSLDAKPPQRDGKRKINLDPSLKREIAMVRNIFGEDGPLEIDEATLRTFEAEGLVH